MSVVIKTDANASKTSQPQEASVAPRNLAQSMLRGAAHKCPNCGERTLFRAYLKVADACAHCQEHFHHHRADDAPPYLTIFVVGHLLIGIMLHLEMAWHVNPIIYIYTLVPLGVILPLAILPSMKGAIVGLQWANHMHGFGHADDEMDDYE